MRISVSQIKQHRSCPQLSNYEYSQLRIPVGQVPVPLGVGTVTHSAFEHLLIGKDWKAAADVTLKELEQPNAVLDGKLIEIWNQWQVIALCIEKGWTTPADWEVLAVEKEMGVTCGKHVIVGRLDGIVRWNDLIWHHQIKTVPSNKPLAIYSQQQRTDWHEAVYQRMLEAFYPDVAGTLLTCVRKLTMKSAVERPHSAFESFFLPRSKEEVDRVFVDLEQEINDIEAENNGTRRIVQNRSHCAGAYGNSLCAYKEVCDGAVSIDDDERFVTIEPRYAEDV